MKAVLEKYYRLIAALIITVYAAVNLYCTTRLSITGDELPYFAYGVNILKLQPQKPLNPAGIPVFNSQLPVTAIAALPRALEQLAKPGLKKTQAAVQADIKNGRIFSVVSALLLALYVLVWAKQLYGAAAGIFSLLLYVLCPDIMAHSQLVGTDVYSFLVFTAACFHGWRLMKTGSTRQLLYLALWLGLGQVTKQSLLLLYPLAACWLLVQAWYSALPLRKKIMQLLRRSAVIIAVSLLVINAGFLFYNTGMPLGKYRFVSARYQQLQQQLSFMQHVPLPLPEPFVNGFDYVAFNTETGPGTEGRSSYGSVSFLGEKTDGKRIWYYYAVCIIFKMPLPFLLCFVAALALYKGYRTRDALYLMLPAAFILLMFSLFNTMYLGIRSVLMVMPPLFVFCGSLLLTLPLRVQKIALPLLLGWQLVSVGLYFPHFLPYTNELILQKKKVHTFFTDSNVFFQEGALLAGEYLQQHPEIQYEPETPVKGRVMVSIENYYDWWNTGRLQWLRNLRLQPVDHFHSGYLIFEVR